MSRPAGPWPTGDRIAWSQPCELVLDLERFVRKSQIAGAENSIPGHIDANVDLRVDAGEYAETSLIQPRHELGLNGIRTPPRATLRLYTPPGLRRVLLKRSQ